MIAPTISRLTGSGVSAVAAYALEGAGAFGIISALFRRKNGKPLPDPWEPGRALFGTFGGPPGDEVIVLTRDPQSYEIHAHGGERLGRWLVGLCVERGAVEGPASSIPGFADQQCAAMLCLAPTERTARILLGLGNGAWHQARSEFLANLAAGDLDAAKDKLERWQSLAPVARHLVEPFVVAIVGPPNAGKSSLLNRLVGFERAVVSPEAGTTRDLVTAETAVEGWPIRLIDTAGLREGGGDLETEGMVLARQQADAADLVIWLHDRSAPVQPTGQRHHFELLTKADVPPHRDWIGSDMLAVSAVTGEGIDGVLGLIAARLVPAVPGPGEGFPPTEDDLTQMHSAFGEADRGA